MWFFVLLKCVWMDAKEFLRWDSTWLAGWRQIWWVICNSFAGIFGQRFKTVFPFSSIFTKTSCRLSTSLICQPLPPGLITLLDIISRLSQTGSDFLGKGLPMVNCKSICDDDKLENHGSWQSKVFEKMMFFREERPSETLQCRRLSGGWSRTPGLARRHSLGTRWCWCCCCNFCRRCRLCSFCYSLFVWLKMLCWG